MLSEWVRRGRSPVAEACPPRSGEPNLDLGRRGWEIAARRVWRPKGVVMEFKRGLIRGVGLAIVAVALAPAIADAASRFTIKPPQPSSTSAITVTFKVPKELPKGQQWILSITDGFIKSAVVCDI